ncbi:MAG TPA: MMPL family transporter [Pilimelia sp.]|nr:MMPL family transporter [Pilimelia sp.]
MTHVLTSIGRACARRPWLTLAVWLALLAGVVMLSSVAGGTLRDQMTVPGTSSERAMDRLLAGFPAEAGAGAHVVARWPAAVDPATLARVEGDLGRVDGVRAVRSATAADGRTALLVVRYHNEIADVPLKAATDALTAAARPLADSGARVAVGGQVPEAIQGPNGVAETIGVVVALAVLLFAFGSALAAGLPLIIACFGLGAGLSLITVLATVTDVNTVSPTLGSMIGLGIGIDYALFIVARYREALLAGDSPVEAAATATGTAGKSVVFAGGTVLIALTGLMFSGIPSFGSMGFAAGLVVLCTVLVSITLLPGLLGATGWRVFARRIRTGRRPARSFRSQRALRLGQIVVRWPVAWLALSVVALLALAAPALNMRLGQNDPGSERAESPTRQAYDIVADAFGPGANGPLTVVADLRVLPGSRLAEVRDAVAATTGIASVTPVATSPDRTTAVFQAVPTTGPQHEQTHDLVRRLQADLPAGADVTGPTAAIVDMTGALSQHLWKVIAAVLAATFVLLVFVFRSLVLPLKAVLTNLLSISAAYGVMTVAFQTETGARLLGLGGPVPIPAWAPMVLFAILFGLSMDYEVFMLSRVREEYQRTRDAAGSVVVGLADTARIVTSAGAIMIAVAVGFALDPGVMVKIVGVGLAAAIFVDITIARLLLVPAAMVLLGDRNWYLPRWLGFLAPAHPACDVSRPASPVDVDSPLSVHTAAPVGVTV